MTLEELRQKMEVCMGKFLDFSMSPTPKHERFYEHLEELKEELNDLMGQFIEANELVRTNEIEYVDTSGEIGASEIEMVKTEIEEVIKMGDGKAEVLTNEEDAVMYTCSFPEDFELEERKANKEGEE